MENPRDGVEMHSKSGPSASSCSIYLLRFRTRLKSQGETEDFISNDSIPPELFAELVQNFLDNNRRLNCSGGRGRGGGVPWRTAPTLRTTIGMLINKGPTNSRCSDHLLPEIKEYITKVGFCHEFECSSLIGTRFSNLVQPLSILFLENLLNRFRSLEIVSTPKREAHITGSHL